MLLLHQYGMIILSIAMIRKSIKRSSLTTILKSIDCDWSTDVEYKTLFTEKLAVSSCMKNLGEFELFRLMQFQIQLKRNSEPNKLMPTHHEEQITYCSLIY
jgi:hypothetical protein